VMEDVAVLLEVASNAARADLIVSDTSCKRTD
jgi:hypothetical protein